MRTKKQILKFDFKSKTARKCKQTFFSLNFVFSLYFYAYWLEMKKQNTKCIEILAQLPLSPAVMLFFSMIKLDYLHNFT